MYPKYTESRYLKDEVMRNFKCIQNFIKMKSFTGITPHNVEGGEQFFERYEPHTTPSSFQGEVTIAWLVSLQSCQTLDRPKVWTVHKQNF